ncbi:lysophospholipid acyltransferase family protein [Spirochaeta isovalerica]|uniref:Lauroyl/myristoyl acyltransferase n=1 Tax=Spirochaeta isovalerica TaxID=150 RepID=A0A841R3S6_9SPIO|nr:lysophospholipid acyltransferase family protein [Spirochaeta isovalerica]MBB6479724.1 lauroyl/myristoyl acyltransferase [Spirochaeta isovalerica]
MSFTLSLSKFLQARLNVLIFRFLPFHTSRLYLLFLGKIYYNLKKKEKSHIKNTLTYVYKDSRTPEELNRIIRETFRGIIAHYHEKLFIAYNYLPNTLKFLRKSVNLTGEEDFKAALDKGKGVILVTAHYGAVEALPGALAVRGYPVTMILRFQTQRLKESLNRRAEPLGLELMDLDEGNVFMQAVNALKKGRILITECDEFDSWRTSKNNPVSFLGKEFDGDRTLEILRKRSGSAVATALMHREGQKKFTMNLKTLITEEDDNRSVSQAALSVLDEAIHKTPYQWYQWADFGEKLEAEEERKKKIENEKEKGFSQTIEENTVSL